MQAILLARVSTEDQDTKAQLIKLKEYAQKMSFVYKEEDVFDFDESAYKGDRRKFLEAVKSLKHKKEKVALCCDKIDRLVRQFHSFLPLLEELRKSGMVEFHFPSDNIVLTSNSPATDLFRVNMGVALAQYYSDSISDNVKRANYKRIKSGLILTKAPYGYRNKTIDEDTKTVEVEQFESKVVLKVFEWYASEAYSLSEIILKLKEEFNVSLAKSQLARILSNKFYIGVCTYKKENLEYAHFYEKIVPDYLFNKVQDIKEGRTKWNGKGKYRSNSSYYGGGLIRCSICEHSISPEKHRGKYSYCCTEYGGKHNAKYVTEDTLTKELMKAFGRLTLTEEKAKGIIRDLKKSNEDNMSISREMLNELNIEKEKIKKRKSKVYDDYADGEVSKVFYEEKLKQYEVEEGRIDEKLQKVEQVSKTFYITAGYIIELARHSAQLFERSEVEERRQLIKLVLLNPRWDGEKLDYDFAEPFNLLANLEDRPLMGTMLDAFRTLVINLENSTIKDSIKNLFEHFNLQPIYY